VTESDKEQPETSRKNYTVVVSDLHINEGRLPGTGAFARMEDFFWDREWLRFCRHLVEKCRKTNRMLRLVLNGDSFDFLQMVRPYDGPLPTKGTERVFGAGTAPAKAVWKINKILEGHKDFVRGLGTVYSAGYEILFITGNHDAELYWPEVKEVIRQKIASTAESEHGTASSGLISFAQWFHIADNVLWIEHGNRYDKFNSFRFQLAPELPNTAGYPDDKLLRLPIGSLFARYLFNPIDNRYPLADNMGDDQTAFLWAVKNHPLSSGRLLLAYGLSFLRVLKKQKLFMPRELGVLRAQHRKRRNELAEKFGIDPAKLAKVDSLQINPTKGGHFGFLLHTLTRIFRKILLPFTVSVFAVFFLLLLSSSIQVAVHNPIMEAITMTLSYLLIFIGALATILLFGSRRSFLRVRKKDPYRKAASSIKELTGVKYVTFGHTHLSDAATLADGGLYFNTGTWTPLFHEEYMPLRELVEFTFVELYNGEVTLKRWNDPRGHLEPALLLERPRVGFPLEDIEGNKPN